jgi:DNA-binding transcriptional LysR family regulator
MAVKFASGDGLEQPQLFSDVCAQRQPFRGIQGTWDGSFHGGPPNRGAGEELKLRLVDRRARAYSLTSAGQQVRDLALRVETAVGDIERFAQSTAGLPQGLVRVSGPPGVTTHFIAPRLLKLQRQHRGLQIELIGESREASLSRREADVALRMSRPHENGLIARKLERSPTACMA